MRATPHFADKFRFEVPTILHDQIHSLDPADDQIDASHDFRYDFRGTGPHYLPATLYRVVVPFQGDAGMFRYQPSSFTLQGVRGRVNGQTVVLHHTTREADQKAVQGDFRDRVSQIEKMLDTQRRDVSRWNDQLDAEAAKLIEARRKEALDALQLTEALGYPLKSRSGPTYTVPVTRKPLAVLPSASPKPFAPEPALEMRQYEAILDLVGRLALTMERSPSTFAKLAEEEIRDHLLLILNDHFDGQATGETFNRSGKTDILIRVQNRNIFIAECKIWDGPKTLTEALDQILSYASWRDTKLAVILFSRRKDFTAVLDEIPKTTATHPSCKKQIDFKNETAWRFLFRQKDDQQREATLTVLAFHVPRGDSDAATAETSNAVTPSSTPRARGRTPRTRRS